jgi:hypothetical protein
MKHCEYGPRSLRLKNVFSEPSYYNIDDIILSSMVVSVKTLAGTITVNQCQVVSLRVNSAKDVAEGIAVSQPVLISLRIEHGIEQNFLKSAIFRF